MECLALTPADMEALISLFVSYSFLGVLMGLFFYDFLRLLFAQVWEKLSTKDVRDGNNGSSNC